MEQSFVPDSLVKRYLQIDREKIKIDSALDIQSEEWNQQLPKRENIKAIFTQWHWRL